MYQAWLNKKGIAHIHQPFICPTCGYYARALGSNCPTCGTDLKANRPINADFYLTESGYERVVFIDGSIHDKARVKIRDKEKDRILESLGIITLHLTNYEVDELVSQ